MGEDVISLDEVTVTEVFERVEPYYLSIGMTYEQFWYGPPRLAVSFRQAEKLRAERANADMWRQGLYMMSAIKATVGNMFLKKGAEPEEYLKEPLPLTEEEIEYREERDERERQDRIRERFREYAAKGGGKHGK